MMNSKGSMKKISLIVHLATFLIICLVCIGVTKKEAKALEDLHFEIHVDYYVYNEVTNSYDTLKVEKMEDSVWNQTTATVNDSFSTFKCKVERPDSVVNTLFYQIRLFEQKGSAYEGCTIGFTDYYIPEGYELDVTPKKLTFKIDKSHMDALNVYNPMTDSSVIELKGEICLKVKGGRSGNAKPDAPSVTVNAGTKKATVKWKAVKDADAYVIYMATSKNGTYKKIKTITDLTKLSYTKKDLKKGKTYYFRVKAYREVIYPNGIVEKVYGLNSSKKSCTVK